jgi:predicted ATPase
LRGELLMRTHSDCGEAAEESLNCAIVVARQLRTKHWELLAATNLAQLWLDWGRRDDARRLLAATYGWFTEGFDTPALQQAKLLLDALG